MDFNITLLRKNKVETTNRSFAPRASSRHRAERESKLVDAPYKARYPISMYNGMTVRSDGEEWALDFGQKLKLIDNALKMGGIDTTRLKQ
jgi:hypothetical protein